MKSLFETTLLHLKLDNKDLKFIGEGFGSLVLENQYGFIIRVAKNLDTAKQYVKEYNILPQLQAKLFPINIPIPKWYHYDTEKVPYGIIAYEKLAGPTLNPKVISEENKKRIAKQLAEFIALIHQTPTDHFQDTCPQEENDRNHFTNLRENTYNELSKNLSKKEMLMMNDWWEEMLQDQTFYSHKSVLCHGDLWYENILVNHQQTDITGIIDFSEVKIGDPAIDLVPHHYIGEDFYSYVLNEYRMAFPNDPTIDERVKKHRGLRELNGLAYAIKHKETPEVQDSIAKIRDVILGT